jgi:hypothetical protein
MDNGLNCGPELKEPYMRDSPSLKIVVANQ